MAASCSSCAASQKKLEDELIAYGMNLMNPPSSTDDLLKLLDKVESLLIMVDQFPSGSTISALQTVMKALVRNEILRHTDEHVKVSVILCITEVSRITAPDQPYDDQKQMEEILWRTVVALTKLSDVSSHNYHKVVHILETVAKLRAFVMLLDFEYDNLVIEIFNIFPRIIRPYHPHNVFFRMEQIMTQLIEDSDELSVELLSPLLDSVKNENQIASPISSKLGEKVLEHCAVIVKPYLAETLKSKSLDPDDCAEIVSSILKMPKGEEMMANENAPDTVHPEQVGLSEAKFCEPELQDETHWEKQKDTCTTIIIKPDNPEVVQPETKAEKSSRTDILTSSSQHSLASEICNISTGSHGHWGQIKEKESPINEDAHLGFSAKDSLHLGFTWGERTKRTLCGKRKPVRDSRKNEFASDYDAERESESSIQNEEGNIREHKEPSLEQIDGMKQQNNEITVNMHNIKESGDKVDEATKLSVNDENHLNECANYKSGRKLDTRKHEDSRPCTIKDHGEELVGTKIKVWSPLDEAFYEAAISSFDPVKNRHKVKYVDGHVERLNLHNERWEVLEYSSSQKLQVNTQREQQKDSCTTNIMKPDNPKDMQPATNVEVVSTRRNKLTGSNAQPSSRSRGSDTSHGSHDHRGHSKKNKTPTNEDHLGMLIAAGNMPETEVKKKVSLHLGCTRGERNKHTVCAKRKPGRGLRKNESASNCETERKTEFSRKGEEVSLQRIHGMKQRKKKTAIKIYDFDESGDKTTQISVKDENHSNKSAKLTSGKNEDSKRPHTIKEYGAELVGARIKIWWPLDEEFYEAAVSSFDPVKKKHKVNYVDGEVEVLKLYKQRWEMLEDNSSQKVDTHREQVKDTCTANFLKPDNPEDEQPAINAELVSRKTSKLTGNVPESQVKKKGSLHLGLTKGERTKHMVCAKRKPERGSRKNESASNCDAERKSEFGITSEYGNIIKNKEFSMQQVDGMKQKKQTTTTMHNIEESRDKNSKRPCTIKDYGKELVGARIRIWWPLDDKFYKATVSSFDPMKRKYKVIYDDGDIEILRLHKERWDILEDNSSLKDHGLDFQGHAVSSVMSKSSAKEKGTELVETSVADRENSTSLNTSASSEVLKILTKQCDITTKLG
ncbi:unnamed protein product [Withania somnifera]